MVELGVPILDEGLGHVLVRHLLELCQRGTGVGLELLGTGHIFFARNVIENIGARVVSRKISAGHGSLDRTIPTGALLMRHIHVQTIGLRLAGQIRAIVAVVLPGQGFLIVLVQACRRVRVRYGIELLATDAIGTGRARRELEQPLRAVWSAAGLFVELATGLDVGKPHEIIHRDVALLGFVLDDVQVFGFRVIACHLVLLLEVEKQRRAPPESTELVL
nr:hypothetical protein [Xanthomonas campestris]